MNKKIEELAEQAGLKLNELPDDIFIPLEKFAELLVRECAKSVSNVYKQGGGTYGETILKQFDVSLNIKNNK
jgi:hypothetical protein